MFNEICQEMGLGTTYYILALIRDDDQIHPLTSSATLLSSLMSELTSGSTGAAAPNSHLSQKSAAITRTQRCLIQRNVITSAKEVMVSKRNKS